MNEVVTFAVNFKFVFPTSWFTSVDQQWYISEYWYYPSYCQYGRAPKLRSVHLLPLWFSFVGEEVSRRISSATSELGQFIRYKPYLCARVTDRGRPRTCFGYSKCHWVRSNEEFTICSNTVNRFNRRTWYLIMEFIKV